MASIENWPMCSWNVNIPLNFRYLSQSPVLTVIDKQIPAILWQRVTMNYEYKWLEWVGGHRKCSPFEIATSPHSWNLPTFLLKDMNKAKNRKDQF